MFRKNCLECIFISRIFLHDHREIPYILNDEQRLAMKENDFSFLKENCLQSFFKKENNCILHCPNDGFKDIGLESFTELESIKKHSCFFWVNYKTYKDKNMSFKEILDAELVKNTRNGWIIWVTTSSIIFSSLVFLAN